MTHLRHRCLEYLIVHGYDPHKYEHVSKEVTKRNGRLPTVEEAQATLNAALWRGVKDRKERAGLSRCAAHLLASATVNDYNEFYF